MCLSAALPHTYSRLLYVGIISCTVDIVLNGDFGSKGVLPFFVRTCAYYSCFSCVQSYCHSGNMVEDSQVIPTDSQAPDSPFHSSQETLQLGDWAERMDAMDDEITKPIEQQQVENEDLPVNNFYWRMQSKECLDAPESKDLTPPPCDDASHESVSDGECDEGVDDLQGYKMITPPGCPVCIMSNAESEGKPSELTPQKILEILMTYMPPADARKTFDAMMGSTATTTQGNHQSASSSSAGGSGLRL